MILPIIAYGDPILKRVSQEISKDHPDLLEFIANMFETMLLANGVGLAAPQLGKNIRLFVVDGSALDELKNSGFRKIFINAYIISQEGESWEYEEGCLSIPGVREKIMRPAKIKIKYVDENFEEKVEDFEGIPARIIQHEHDHLDGKLFIDYLSPLKRQLIKGKLGKISKGITDAEYKMKFPIGGKR
ncbi:MAG: peptide deformylase [Cytophagales bacterium]